MVTGTSALCTRDAVIGMPISAVTSVAVSCARASRAMARRSMAAARSAWSARGQGPVSNACRAAQTATADEQHAGGTDPRRLGTTCITRLAELFPDTKAVIGIGGATRKPRRTGPRYQQAARTGETL